MESGFFNSKNGDRVYKAEDFARYFASFVGNGVFPNPSTNLQVAEGQGMKVAVRPGRAWINGYFFDSQHDYSIALDTADGVFPRIDRVVVRWSLAEREIALAAKKGALSSSPAPPGLQRDGDVYELALADVAVPGGAASITQADIADKRLDSGLCGLVAGTVGELETSAYYAQLQGLFELCRSKSAGAYDDFVVFMGNLRTLGGNDYATFGQWLAVFQNNASAEVKAWFQGMKDALDENAATNLYLQIAALGERVERLELTLFAGGITSNPYAISFDALDGVSAFGVWNQALGCLEC